jgi:hypothetical protein
MAQKPEEGHVFKKQSQSCLGQEIDDALLNVSNPPSTMT